jgi:hypothetical protein
VNKKKQYHLKEKRTLILDSSASLYLLQNKIMITTKNLDNARFDYGLTGVFSFVRTFEMPAINLVIYKIDPNQ